MSATIVADIGGTHTRFGLWRNGALEACEKFKTASFATVEESIAAYQAQHNLSQVKNFAFATAANPFADGIWRFTNLEGRKFSLSDISKAGYNVLLAEDDFSATTYGCLALPENDKTIVSVKKAAGRKGDPKVVLGPGTGLGMGYALYNPDGTMHRVQKAYGAHMLLTSISDEHVEISRRVKQKRKLDRPVIFEDIACGSSFQALYEVCCEMTGTKPATQFFDDRDHAGFKKAMEIFHETLGLFAHLCVVTVHGFGGLMLNGGFLDALLERKLWQPEMFLKGFHQKGVPVVTEDILNTPVSIVTDTYISLIGVGKMIDA